LNDGIPFAIRRHRFHHPQNQKRHRAQFHI
jgi:hypothetical protein